MELLFVIDVQNDFVTGALGTPQAVDIVPEIKAYMDQFKGAILVTQDTHTNAYPTTQEGQYLPVAHCQIGTIGHELHPLIAASLDHIQTVIHLDDLKTLLTPNAQLLIQKNTFSDFELFAQLRTWITAKDIHIDAMHFVGLCTDICVISHAIVAKAACPETPLYVHPALCAGSTSDLHQAALTTMRSLQIQFI